MCENAITLHNLISTVNDLQYQKKILFRVGVYAKELPSTGLIGHIVY